MGWFSDDKPKPDEDKPWNKPLTPEQLDRLRKALKKQDPKDKNAEGKNPPKKGGLW